MISILWMQSLYFISSQMRYLQLKFKCVSMLEIYLIRSMICTPESVSIMSDISPTFKLNATSSNGFCIWPREKGPKSPPRLAELQSEYFCANSARVASPDFICN